MSAARPTHAQRMAYVDVRLKAIGRARVRKAQKVAREGEPDLISGALLIAISLRESGGRNVLGDQGHARGAFQIHDAYWRDYLRTVVGCRAAKTLESAGRLNWVPVPFTNAAMAGFCPTYEDGARGAVLVLTSYIRQAQRLGLAIHSDDVLKVAVAAYNTGFAQAHQGYREGDADKYTTGANYAGDVLRRRSEVAEWLRKHPNWTP